MRQHPHYPRLLRFQLISQARLFASLLLLAAVCAQDSPAQAGGGAGGAGSGSAGGSGGASAPAGGSAAGQPGAAGAASRGAASSSGQPGANNATTAPQQAGTPQSAAAAYAAGASAGPDPRKPPLSKPGAYTMGEIVSLAEAHNPTLLAAQSNLRAVRAQELQAAVRANPYLTLYGTNVTLPAAGASNPYAYSAQVSRLFERGDKRRYRIEAARATTGQTQAQLDDTVRQTVLTIRQGFTKMLVSKLALELSLASLKDFQHEVEISRDRYQAGDLGRLDYERLDLQLGSYESDVSNNHVALRQASDQLQTLVGVETPTADFDIRGDVVPPALTATQAELLHQALLKRPDFAAARAAVNAATANAQLAIANGTADPTLEGEYDRSGTYNSAGFSINIPLRLFDRNQGNKETARNQVEASRSSELAARNQVISDVDQAWVGYTENKGLSDRFSGHYLDESRDVLSIAQYAFEHGGLALIDYLDALRDARSSTSDALNAFANTWNAIHQLSAATATDVTP